MVNGFLNANQIHESGLPIVNGVLNANQIRESGFHNGKCISSLSLFHVFCKGTCTCSAFINSQILNILSSIVRHDHFSVRSF